VTVELTPCLALHVPSSTLTLRPGCLCLVFPPHVCMGLHLPPLLIGRFTQDEIHPQVEKIYPYPLNVSDTEPRIVSIKHCLPSLGELQ
jgi:hypothetical protein